LNQWLLGREDVLELSYSAAQVRRRLGANAMGWGPPGVEISQDLRSFERKSCRHYTSNT